MQVRVCGVWCARAHRERGTGSPLTHPPFLPSPATTGPRGYAPLTDHDPADIASVVSTNLGATLAAARLAGQRLGSQPRGGHFVCVVGAGAGGDATPGYAAYGATKAALAQLTRSLAAEAADARARDPESPAARVGWHTLSPGLMLSPLLLTGTVGASSSDGPVRARVRAAVFNALAAPPEVSAAHAVPRLRSAVAARAAGVKVTYLTPLRAVAKLIASPFTQKPLDPTTGAPRWAPERERLAARATRRAVARAAKRSRGLGLSYATSMVMLWLAIVGGW